VALQQAEMRMVRWMCDVKVKDRVPSKELREIRNRWYNHRTATIQVAMVWACVAKRRHWLGEEIYGRASDQEVDQRGHGERLCKKIAKHVIWTGRMLWMDC